MPEILITINLNTDADVPLVRGSPERTNGGMIHHTCDACQQPLGPDDSRFIVRMEVYRALDEVASGVDEDRDHLEEIDDYLARLDDFSDPQRADGASQQLRFDLCEDCHKNFLADPLGRRVQQLDFSKN
jgi:hypothetical protein